MKPHCSNINKKAINCDQGARVVRGYQQEDRQPELSGKLSDEEHVPFNRYSAASVSGEMMAQLVSAFVGREDGVR